MPARLKEGKVHIAVYGAGRVGVTIAAAWLRAGAKVVMADIDRSRIETILRGDATFRTNR